jgi:DNA-binding NtrC family response regulator
VSARSRVPTDLPILLVEDKDSLRTMLRHALEAQGHTVVEARDQPEAEATLKATRPAIVLSDLRLPEGDGFGVLRAAKELEPELPVIVMTAFGSIQDAVAAMKEGALDFLAKPVDPDHLLLMVERALMQRRLATENLILKEELAQRRGAPTIVGDDVKLKQVSLALHRAAGTDTTVLLEGESGTGKELFARALHALSPRADGPFIAINCAAIPETLLETELFGHEKGAFTGASARKPGKFELAHRGTLFLDEIGDLPLSLQAKILRALEEKRFERVGGTVSLQVDVRVVAATNRNLKAAVAARQYREDLYFRLSVFPIVIPPLRDRPDDIPTLARYFIDKFCRELNKASLSLSPAAEQELRVYGWPGNVRELQNCIERAVILTEGETIHPRHLNLSFRDRAAAPAVVESEVSPWATLDWSGSLADVSRRVMMEVERRKIELALKEAAGNRGRAAANHLQDADHEAARVRTRNGESLAHPLKPTRFSASRISFSVTSSTIVVAPTVVGRTKCSRPATIFLSCCIASIICDGERSAIGGSGPRLAMRSASA